MIGDTRPRRPRGHPGVLTVFIVVAALQGCGEGAPADAGARDGDLADSGRDGASDGDALIDASRDAEGDTDGACGASVRCGEARVCHEGLCCEVPPRCSDPAECSPLDGTFMLPRDIATADLPRYFDELESLGMDTIVIATTRTKPDGCDSTEYRWEEGLPDMLGDIFDEAETRGFEVYVGLARTNNHVCRGAYYNDPNASLTIADTSWAAERIQTSFGDREAFRGWYIADEPHLSGWSSPPLTYEYYRGLVDAIREWSALPILAAPELAGSEDKTPAEIAARAADFRDATGVDIYLWQDSVGANGIDIGWRDGAWTVGDYYSAISAAIGREHIWSDNELFTCCTNLPPRGDPEYRPASVSRLARQLEETSYDDVARRTVWIQQHHMGSVDRYHHPESARMLAAFRARYGLGGQLVVPRAYRWITEPADRYADSGGELFDGVSGDPRSHFDESWIGVAGDRGGLEVEIELESSSVVDWVAVHLLDDNASGILLPTAMTLSCSTDGERWEEIAIVERPAWISEQDSEYVFGNLEPLGVLCQDMRIRLDNRSWTFVSEVEMVASLVGCTP